MNLERALAVLNEMEKDGVIGKYAIGGAVAAFLYIEPGTTFDLDIFITWEIGTGGLLDLGPIYQYLARRGCKPQREGILIEGWEVQFLPSAGELEKEALEQSTAIEISGVPTRIFTREHLMAICLKTARPKDFARLVQFLEEGRPDEQAFLHIVKRHGLVRQWADVQKRFPDVT